MMQEDLGLGLKITADTETLERDIKALSKKLIANLTLDLSKAEAQLNQFRSKVEKGKVSAKLSISLTDANDSIKKYKKWVESSSFNLTANVVKAEATLKTFQAKVEKSTTYLQFGVKPADLNKLTKQLDLQVDIDFKKAFDVLKKFKTRVEKVTFKPSLDLNVTPANATLATFRSNIKSNPLQLDANLDKARDALKSFQAQVSRTTAYAGVSLDTPVSPTQTPSQRSTTPQASQTPNTPNQTRAIPVEVVAETEEATRELNAFEQLLERVGDTEEQVTRNSLDAAYRRVASVKEQVTAAKDLVKAVEKAQQTLGKKTSDLDVARARVNVLEEQVRKTRELAALGSRTDADVQAKRAALNQAKERVKLLDAEIIRLRQLANSQDAANRALANSTNSLNRANGDLQRLQGASRQASDAGGGLLKTFAGFSIVSSLIDRATDALLELPGAVIRATLEVEKLKAQLDFSTGGNGAEQLEELFDKSQKLGVSFKNMAGGYAQFAATAKGTSLEQDTDLIFDSVSKASAALKLSAEDTQGVFTALSQMSSKGVVSMEEFRQQLGERLPVATSAGVKALQTLVEQGAVPLSQINKSLSTATEETRKAYKVTNADLIAYISSGKALSSDFLPAFGKALNDTFKDVETEGLQQSLNRATNMLLKFGASIGNALSPLLTAILDKFTEVLDYVLNNTDAIFGAFKPLLGIGELVMTALAGIEAAFKAFFGQGVIETLLSFLDEIAIALLVVFGAPLIALIGSAVAAIASFVVAFAPVIATVIAVVGVVKLLSSAIQSLAKWIDELTGGAISKGIEWFGKKFGELKDYIALVNSELKQTKIYIDAIAEGLGSVGTGTGKAFNAVGLAKYTDALIDLQNALTDIDISELEAISNIDEQLAAGTIADSDAAKAKIESAIASNQARLEVAVATYENSVSGLADGVKGKAAEDLIKARDQASQDIQQLKSKLAQDSVAARQAAIDAELEVVKKAGDALQRETTMAELKRIEVIRQLAASGNVYIAQAEEDRLQLSEDRIKSEIKLEEDRIATLTEIADGLIDSSSQQNDILNQIVEAEQKRSDLIAEQAQLEVERQKALEIQVEIQATKLEGEKHDLEMQAELLNIANELKKTQNDLAQAQFTFAAARLSLEQTYAKVELDRLDHAIQANDLLLQVDKDRRDVVAERLGLEPGTNEIELVREREAKEQEITVVKQKQLELQQKSERQQLEFQRTQIKFEADQEKYRLKAATLEARISKLKSEQAVSSAMAARSAALAAGDTQAAAQAELEILQARQQSSFADDQLKLISAQTRALEQQTKIQNQILDTQMETLDTTHEQQQVELDLENIAQQRADALRIEQQLLEESVKTRSLAREEALLELKYGNESQQRRAELITSQNELNDLQDTYNRQLEYVESLQASGVLNANEELILTRETNKLGQTRLDILNAEFQIQSEIEDAKKAGNDIALKDARLALQYGTEETKLAAETLEAKQQLNDIQARYSEQLAFVTELEGQSLVNASDELSLAESRNDLQQLGLELLQAEYEIEEKLANEIAQQREKALERQVSILEQRKTLIEAEAGLVSAQADLRTAQLEGDIIDVNRDEALGGLSKADADEERAELQLKMLEAEKEATDKQQEADLKRLEIEQQIEIMRLRATQAEAEVTRARAEVSLAESQAALGRAVASGDQDAIDAAESAISASESAIESAQSQVDLIGEQIEATLELQKIQMETIETQQKADDQRLKNKERELELVREIAAVEASNAANSNDGFRGSGGGVSAGNTYTVGEQGTELFQGADGSTKLLGVNGQHSFTPHVPGKIISNHALEQVIAANVMRSDQAVVEAIQQGFKRSGLDFSKLAGVLANRTQKPVVVNNYGSGNAPTFDANRAKLARL